MLSHVASNESKIKDLALSRMRLAHAWDRMWWEASRRDIYHDILVWGQDVSSHVRRELPASRPSASYSTRTQDCCSIA